MPNVAHYKKILSEKQIKDILGLIADKAIPYTEIEAAYNLTPWELQALTKDYGIRRNKPHVRRNSKLLPASRFEVNGSSTTLTSVEAQLQEAQRRMAEQQEEIKRLQILRESLSIRFEWDKNSDNVSVYGILSDPVSAPAESWMVFLNNEGARKLREFITHRKVQ